ncbi:hypothetical protein [Halobellus rubicundus]|uniref:Uncharacterized protein n=1 Tax=Halobellus rubicundus TaxID=2996466 RepID=A0ABD5MCU8_9EURY
MSTVTNALQHITGVGRILVLFVVYVAALTVGTATVKVKRGIDRAHFGSVRLLHRLVGTRAVRDET